MGRTEKSVYDLVELLKHRNSIARGVLEVIRALERHRAKLVVIARDAAIGEKLDLIRSLCEERDVRVVVVSSKEELGRAAGLEVGASCVALPVMGSIELE